MTKELKIYYSNDLGEHTIYLDEGTKQTRIPLPADIDPADARIFATSKTAVYVLIQTKNTEKGVI